MALVIHPGRRSILAALFLLCLPRLLEAQPGPDSVTVALAPQFSKEWPYGILFGSHHQSLWTTPVTIELLDLSSRAGGLTPSRELVTPDSRFLLLSTSAGDTVVFTPLRERFADDEADPRDRRLIPVHPSSALVVDRLSEAAGLGHGHLRLVWLPDDPLLGPFRETYGGSAGFLASAEPGEGAASGSFIDSKELFRALDTDSRNAVDARRFLFARLLDLFTGDWERSIWKWWWIAAPGNGGTTYSLMPALRRHSLLMLSLFPASVHGALTPGFLNFTADLSDVSRAVTTGAALDVRILAGMSRIAWEGIAREFQTRMSDPVIDAAVLSLPLPHRLAEADTIARMLKSRRDSLASVSSRYYLTIAEYAEVRLSHVAEYVTVERREDGRVDVAAWQRGVAEAPVFSRTFLPDETTEIRLHCLGGNDTVIVRGRADRSIVVRINGGPGDDTVADEAVSGATTYIYDHEGINELTGGDATSIDTTPESEFVPPGRFF
jgi:hypothetical protein